MAWRPVIYLTIAEVEEMNRQILLGAGQRPLPVRDRGLLEGALQRPRNAAFYEARNLLEQAALYMVGIAINHPFVDGNKRTGYSAGMTFLRTNAYIGADPDLNHVEFGQWLEMVVSHTMAFEEFVANLRKRLPPPAHSA